MRARLIVILAVVLSFSTPAAVGMDSEARQTPTMSVWQPGGIDLASARVVAETVDAHRGGWVIVRSGTIQLTKVSRGEEVIQEPRPGYRVPMSTIALDPEAARDRIGDEAADALLAGTLVFGQASADLRGAMVGDTVRFNGWDRRTYEVEIGAIVGSNHVGSAEMVFSAEMADEFGFDRLATVWVWDIPQQDAFLIDLWRALPDTLTRIRSSNDPVDPDSVLSVIDVKLNFGEFSYRPLLGDNIVIDPEWVADNIEVRTIPILGQFRCHKKVWPLLEEAISQINQAEIDGLISRNDFRSRGGCYNAREIRGGDKGGSLSRHSWGIAIDINPSTNPYGGRITMNPAIVDIFHDLGFAWGGGWTFSDGGHFEWTHEVERLPG